MPSEHSSVAERQSPITVVLVDDERLIRAALARALTDDGIELVGEAGNGEDAIETVLDLRPDVVLMDLKLPGLSGVQAIEQLGLAGGCPDGRGTSAAVSTDRQLHSSGGESVGVSDTARA